MTKLTIAGVCNQVVFKWLLLWLVKEDIKLEDVREEGEKHNEKTVIFFYDEEDGYYTYNHLKGKTHEAEADYALELTSY